CSTGINCCCKGFAASAALEKRSAASRTKSSGSARILILRVAQGTRRAGNRRKKPMCQGAGKCIYINIEAASSILERKPEIPMRRRHRGTPFRSYCLLVIFVLALLLTPRASAQSTDSSSSASQQEQTPPEAGVPQGNVSPIVVPKKKEEPPPPPKPKVNTPEG